MGPVSSTLVIGSPVLDATTKYAPTSGRFSLSHLFSSARTNRILLALLIFSPALRIRAGDETGKTSQQAKSADPAAIEKFSDLLTALKATKGKVILLQVWAVGCSRCMAEMPLIVKASTETFGGNKDVAFLGVCLAEEGADKKAAAEAAGAVVRKKAIPFTNLVWTGKGAILQEKLNVQGTPYTALLSADGTVLGEIELPRDPDKADAAIRKAVAAGLEQTAAARSKSAPANK